MLVVEITSPTTAEKDRTSKYQLYQQQGVSYYAIADPEAKTLEVFRLGPAGQYQPLPADGTTYRFEIRRHEINLAAQRLFE